jgi:S1-C subfamily serine protease
VADDELRKLQTDFTEHSGARLVFDASDLPPGQYFDKMPSLSADRRVAAARIMVREAHKLPQGYLRAVGLKAVGVFAACVSSDGDGFRPYDPSLKGYRYYGIWNGKDGVAAAYYSNEQLPLTFHHEVFHHVDGTLRGRTDGSRLHRDDRFAAVLAGNAPYPAPRLSTDELAALRRQSGGSVLEEAVSDYARKSKGEDKAETARYLMSHLPDALVQMATRPQLPGSQRMLHVLSKYEQAPAEGGPGIAWFVGVALGRPSEPVADAPAAPKPAAPADAVARLLKLAAADRINEVEAREALCRVEALSREEVAAAEAREVVLAAARLSDRLLREMIAPGEDERTFRVRGQEDESGVNQVLRQDLAAIGELEKRLRKIAALAPAVENDVTSAQLRSLRLLARYYQFIASQWKVTDGTRHTFEGARDTIVAALPAAQAAVIKERTGLQWERLADVITARGAVAVAAAPVMAADNPYLAKVDAAISDPRRRAAIRHAQPACVRLSNGSGVNIAPEGMILTAGHCTDGVGSKVSVRFPDGREFTATCTAFDNKLDLAVCTIAGSKGLPFARLAAAPAETGDWIACIGQPGSYTPGGEPTGYKPFHVSTGEARGRVGNPLGDQSLGRLKHDAWTYWGHSGSPLFNESGALVGLHNSWDSTTAMRRAVPYQAIVHFLRREKVPFTKAE